jgi:signal transduction histidine kinase
MTSFFRSMGGRVFLILVVGIVASASLTGWLAFGERQHTIGQFREARAIEQAEQFILTLDAIPAAGRAAFLSTARRFGLKGDVVKERGTEIQETQPRAGIARILSERLGKDFRVMSLPPTPQSDCAAARGLPAEAAAPVRGACETIGVRLRDDSEIRLTILPRGPLPPPRTDFVIYLTLFICSIAALAYLVSRMTMQPLKQLARAAEELGNNIDRPPLTQQGASEIRQATSAFNAMQARIHDHIRQRTQMLAAITHDLQTPLTRLRLRLEKVDDPALREKLIDDLTRTQAIVREGLDLARSIDATETFHPLDLDSLLDSVCSDAVAAAQTVTLEGNTGASVMARPLALRRCLTNLVDNAVKYGQAAHITAQKETVNGAIGVCIKIRDDGPGIPNDQLEKVFEPFYRVETSRSRQTGGTGLGLTIARNIAEQHGGSVTLAESEQGGLEVVLFLPIKSAV